VGKSLIIRARRAEHPEETQQATADAVGCSRQLVTKLEHEIATKNSQWEEKVAPPDWIRRHDDQAAFRRLPSPSVIRTATLDRLATGSAARSCSSCRN